MNILHSASSNEWTSHIFPLTVRQLPSSNKRTSCQLASSNRRTSCIFLLPLSNDNHQVLTNKHFAFTITMFQIASSNKWTFYIFLFTITMCQVTSSNKRTILQLPYSFLISVIPRVSVQEVSTESFVFIKLSSEPIR